jgi:hypothetical protein
VEITKSKAKNVSKGKERRDFLKFKITLTQNIKYCGK